MGTQQVIRKQRMQVLIRGSKCRCSSEAKFAAAGAESASWAPINVLETKNDFPVNIGVSISCIPSMETTRNGQSFALTCLSSCHNPTPITVFEADASNAECV